MSGTLIAIIIFIILLLAGFIIAGFLTNWFGLIDDSTVKPPAVTPSVAPTAATPSVAPSATSTVTPSALSGYIEGRYIKLTRTNSENKPLNISEISVFDTSNNKITQLTGSLSPVSSDFGWMGPELLFNNNLDDFIKDLVSTNKFLKMREDAKRSAKLCEAHSCALFIIYSHFQT
jgi:hypothetical protein